MDEDQEQPIREEDDPYSFAMKKITEGLKIFTQHPKSMSEDEYNILNVIFNVVLEADPTSLTGIERS